MSDVSKIDDKRAINEGPCAEVSGHLCLVPLPYRDVAAALVKSGYGIGFEKDPNGNLYPVATAYMTDGHECSVDLLLAGMYNDPDKYMKKEVAALAKIYGLS